LEDAEECYKIELEKNKEELQDRSSIDTKIRFPTYSKESQNENTMLQIALKDTKALAEKWQQEIDQKTDEIEALQEELNKNKLQIVYLKEQNRLLLNCNKTNLNRLKNLLSPQQNIEDIERQKLVKQLEDYRREIERLKTIHNEPNEQSHDISLLRDNMQLKERLAICEKQVERLNEEARNTVKLKGQLEKIARELIILPEIKAIYESRIKGKDSIQQIACALDYFLKLIRVCLYVINRNQGRHKAITRDTR